MPQTRLKSSFIYLANAVNDLRGNWMILAAILAPLVLAASLCVLPDALNIQSRLAQTFEPGTQTIAYIPAQSTPVPARPPLPERRAPYPKWLTTTLHLLSGVITLAVNLIVLCWLQRLQSGARAPDLLGETIEVYSSAFALLPAFAWIVLLQWLATLVGFVLLVVPSFMIYIWLYFSQYALVFDHRHSWPALLFSRDLMRGRFFKIAVRIVVFLAVWSGYNSWTAGTFVLASILMGPVSVITNTVAGTVFLMDFIAVAVSYATAAFFIAAGVRLYQDLVAMMAESAPVPAAPIQTPLPPTVPLGSAQA